MAGAITVPPGKEKPMKKLLLFGGVLLALATVGSIAADGKADYERACAKCHGKDGRGQTKMGRRTGAKDYTDPKVQEAVTDNAAFKAVKEGFKDKHGKVLMKPADDMNDEAIRAVVAYMRTFKK